MTKCDAIRHFGSQAALARALGITRAAVNGWGPTIPYVRQCQIQVVTRGALQADAMPDPSAEPTRYAKAG